MADAEKLMEFLEETLPQIVTPTTDALYAVSIDEDRVPKTVFYNCNPVDRWAIIGAIFADAMLAFVEDNADEIRKILNGEDEDDG